jgi:hypothetical protein
MRSKHRRTESDSYYNTLPIKRFQFKLKLKQNNTVLDKILKDTNRKHKNKTIMVEFIENPQSRSQQNLIFNFGKKGYDTPLTGISTQHD